MKKVKRMQGGSGGGAVYGIGFIGAAVYFLQHATSIWDGVLGIIKAIVWPGILVHRVLELLRM